MRKLFKKVIIGISAAVLATGGLLHPVGATPGETSIGGFSFPESAIHDRYTDRYLVSNMGNAPGAPAAEGYISALSPNGQVLDHKWIDGAAGSFDLNDPAGMAVYAGKLYVADNQDLRVFNVFTGQYLTSIHISGATSLNDVTAYWGGVIVSDPGFDFSAGVPTGTDAIYKVNGLTNQVTTLAAGPQLANPNGLYYDITKGLLAAPMTSPTIYLININNGQMSDFTTLPDVGYDGIAKTGGKFYFNNPPSGHLYRTDNNGGNSTLLATYPNFPADINADQFRNRLLIPQLLGGSMIIKQL